MNEEKSYFVMKSITEDNMCELCARNNNDKTFPYSEVCEICKHNKERKKECSQIKY